MTHTTKELERLMAEATPLPWHARPMESRGQGRFSSWTEIFSDNISLVHIQAGEHAKDDANAALIVAAVNALPELLALRKENERLREALKATRPYRAEFGAIFHEDQGGFLFTVSSEKMAKEVAKALNIAGAARAALSQETGS